MKAITVLASIVRPAFNATQRFSIAVSRSFSNAVADAEAGRLLGSPLTRNEHLYYSWLQSSVLCNMIIKRA